MVIALALLTSLSAQPVVRFADGTVSVTSTGSATTIETGADGFAEIHLHRIGRLRLSAATRATIGGEHVRLSSGRVWAQVGKSRLVISTLQHRAVVHVTTSAIIERTTGGGTSLAVRAGSVTLSDGEDTQLLEQGQTLRLVPGIAGLPAPRTGGRGTGELVTVEARRAMNDPLGIESFLLSRSEGTVLSQRPALGVEGQVRSTGEITGAEGGVFGNLVEEGFRPPPFFEQEVPPKGPNVRVEVEFEP